MAIKPNNNQTFLREVDEELRKEQLANFWQRYRIAIIVGVVLLLAAVGGFIWWQNQRQAKAGEQGEALIEALETAERGNMKAAAPIMDRLAESNNEGYRAAALFSRANAAVEANNMAGAVAALKGIADDESFAEPYRHAALIRQTALEFDRIPPQTVIQRLTPLAQPGSAWFGSAGEMVGVAHLKSGQPRLAAPIFSALARDENVPSSIRARAVQMAGSLGVDAVQESAATGGAQRAQPAPAGATKGKGQ